MGRTKEMAARAREREIEDDNAYGYTQYLEDQFEQQRKQKPKQQKHGK